MSDGTRYSARHAERALDVADVEVHACVRPVEHELQLAAGQREQVERLDADLQVLDARDVHARDEQDVVGLLDQREHDVVEVRRHVDDDEVEHPPQHADDADHLLGRDLVARRRLDRRAQHAQRRRFVRREQAVHQLLVGGLDRAGGVGRRVQRRDAEQHRDVAELQVAVDEHDAAGRVRREHDRQVRRDDALADAALGREGDDDLAELRRRRPRPRRGRRAPSIASPTRSIAWRICDSPASIVIASRTPARSACCSSGSVSSSASSTTPASGNARVDALRPPRSPSSFARLAPNSTTVGSPVDELAQRLVERRHRRRARCPRARASSASASRSSGSSASTR